jgi:hypothetical protein
MEGQSNNRDPLKSLILLGLGHCRGDNPESPLLVLDYFSHPCLAKQHFASLGP